MRTLLRTSLLFVTLALGGCATQPDIPLAAARPLNGKEWVGTWVGTRPSYYNHNSTQAIVLRSNGTGVAIDSSIFDARSRPPCWITASPLTWKQTSPTQVAVTVGSKETIYDDGENSLFGQNSGVSTLSSTQTGLRTNILSFKDATFAHASDQPDENVAQKIIGEVAQQVAALGGDMSPGGNSGNQIAGVSLAAAGLGATARGNAALGQQLSQQAVRTYTGNPQTVNTIGNYNRNTYFTNGQGTATESTANPTGTDAQLREAYPDGKAWDYQFLSGSIWKRVYGARTEDKDQMLEQGKAVSGPGVGFKNHVLSNSPYKPYSGMKIGVEAIDPPAS